ncbi:DUF4861 family protein [Sphingobacterium spiritivorum]|uniref:DUF4861 family protein n=1 Tax=Sphingobacterium spiritivorum TaxID=258 RepID=UPI003DA5C201
MKKTFIAAFVALALAHSLSAQQKIVVKNPGNHSRHELISIPYSSFTKHFKVDSVFTIVNAADGSEVAHQLEKLGQSSPQNVLVEVNIGEQQEQTLTVKPQKGSAFQARTYARYVPERKDDFAWENDIAAYRAYGKALEGTSEDAQGFDFWSKRTSELVINEWYKTGDYHADHGKGLDYYSVGQTLGVGDLALFVNGNIKFTKHYRKFEVLDNGPIRSTFKLIFEPEEIEGNTIELSKTISIDAGSQLNKIQVELKNNKKSSTAVVIGLSRRGEEKPAYQFANNSLAYWEPTLADKGTTGTAVLFGKDKITLDTKDPKQFLVHTTIPGNKKFVYYNGAAWDRAGKITTAQEWFDYVKQQQQNISKPLKVTLK